MVVNKNQLSKTATSMSAKKKLADKFKNKIDLEVKILDDTQSSKYVVNNPDLSKEYNQVEEKNDMDLEEARRMVLDLIKGQRQLNVEQSQPGFLHLSKFHKAKPEAAKMMPKVPENQESPKVIALSRIKTKLKSLIYKKEYPAETIKKVKKSKLLRLDPNSKLKIISTALVIFLFVVFLIMVSGIYLARWQGFWVIKFTQMVPLPVAYVKSQQVKASSFFKDIAVLEAYFRRQNLPISLLEIRQQTLNKQIEFKIIQQLAEADNLLLTEEEIQHQLSKVFEDQKSDQVDLLTQELYGWTFDQYLEKVLKPLLLRDKVEENFYNSDGGRHIKDTINGLYGLIIENQSRFSEIASQVNQDESYAAKGDLGWLKLGEVSPEIELRLLDLQPGEISPVVETRYGYHIIRLEEKMLDDSDQPIFHVSHIFLKRPSFDDYLNEQIKKATIVTLIRI